MDQQHWRSDLGGHAVGTSEGRGQCLGVDCEGRVPIEHE